MKKKLLEICIILFAPLALSSTPTPPPPPPHTHTHTHTFNAARISTFTECLISYIELNFLQLAYEYYYTMVD